MPHTTVQYSNWNNASQMYTKKAYNIKGHGRNVASCYLTKSYHYFIPVGETNLISCNILAINLTIKLIRNK